MMNESNTTTNTFFSNERELKPVFQNPDLHLLLAAGHFWPAGGGGCAYASSSSSHSALHARFDGCNAKALVFYTSSSLIDSAEPPCHAKNENLADGAFVDAAGQSNGSAEDEPPHVSGFRWLLW